jgi:hypothetical protein
VNRSLIVPPVFVSGALPPRPWMNRHTRTVAMFGASATGIWNKTRKNHDPM